MAGPRPAAELAVGGVGAAVFGGQVLPGAGGTGDPEDGVQRAAPVGGRAAAGVVGAGEVAGEEVEFGVGEGVGAHNQALKELHPGYPSESQMLTHVRHPLFEALW